ncbi:MAG: hypothetical protein H6625_12920 [Bdellovibrionaceae bacterium]|nr:hypothetical protein [Pseudobdellovibrionaceae bacterium]
MKQFSFRSYSSKYYRPQPIVIEDLEKSFLSIATPWGAKTTAEKSSEIIQEFYQSARGDQEATSPFEFVTSLSQEANDLRMAILFANEKICNSVNQSEYLSGCEFLTMTQVGNEVHFVQIGQPAIYLLRNGIPLLPMACHIDMSMNFSSRKELLSPLPTQLLGIESSIDFSVNTFIPQSRDKILFLSRTFAPSSFLNISYENANMDVLVNAMSKENPENPFWIGILDF